jgi:hypothetical protein
MCDHGDYDGNDAEVSIWRRARIAHECCACELPIRRGDRYHIWRTLYDGSWSTLKHCERCWAMVDALGDADFTGGSVMLTLNCGETWDRASGGPPPPHIAALAFWLPGEPVPEPAGGRGP